MSRQTLISKQTIEGANSQHFKAVTRAPNKVTEYQIQYNLKIHPSKTKEMIASQQTNYTRSRTRRYFESVGGDLESTTEHERSYRSNTIIMCVITICLKNSSVARPSSSRAVTGCQTDHRHLPAICLAGMVGLYHRRAVTDWRGFLPADSPSVEELARDADLGLFRSISANPCHVLRHYFHEREHTGHNLRHISAQFCPPDKG